MCLDGKFPKSKLNQPSENYDWMIFFYLMSILKCVVLAKKSTIIAVSKLNWYWPILYILSSEETQQSIAHQQLQYCQDLFVNERTNSKLILWA